MCSLDLDVMFNGTDTFILVQLVIIAVSSTFLTSATLPEYMF